MSTGRIPLRKFNRNGLVQTAIRLQEISAGQSVDFQNLLLDNDLTEVISEVTIEVTKFETRRAAGEYFSECLDPLRSSMDVDMDAGLWTWLAVNWMDEYAPVKTSGKRDIKELNRWLLASDNYQRYYRHMFAGPYYVYRAHRDKPDRANAVLCTPVDKPGEVVGQIASRQSIVRSKGLMEAVTLLYYDAENKKLKAGAGGKQTMGSARRLSSILLQLDLTWDVANMSGTEILRLLPAEFKAYMPDA